MFKLAPSKEINIVAHSSLKQVNIETAQRDQISLLLPFLKKNVKTFFVLHTFYFFFHSYKISVLSTSGDWD